MNQRVGRARLSQRAAETALQTSSAKSAAWVRCTVSRLARDGEPYLLVHGESPELAADSRTANEKSALQPPFIAVTLFAMSTEALEKQLTYEEERGKPMPSFNHGAIQANLIVEFARQPDFRVCSELTLEFEGQHYTPDLSLYPRTPLDLRHDVIRRTDPPFIHR